ARVRLVSGEGAHPRGDLGRLPVRAPRHERGDRGLVGRARVGVVWKPACHQDGAEVRVAEPELAVGLRIALDLRRRIARVADEDLLRQEGRVDRGLEGLDVELAVLAAELHQVQRGEVARAVVDGHVLGARVRRVDAARVLERVPLVYLCVVMSGPWSGSVCHLWIAVSSGPPAPPQRHAASAACLRRSRAGSVATTAPSVRAVKFQSSSRSTASMKESVTRIELFAFWYYIDAHSGEFR